MKKLSLFILCLASFCTYAQTVPSTYTADFKPIFEAAKKYYKTDKKADGASLPGPDFIKEYESLTSFQNALYSKLVADKDGVLNHRVLFNAGKTKEEALETLKLFVDATKPLMPPKFKENKSINVRYIGMQGVTLEYDSELFAEVAKKPTVTFGVIEEKGEFKIEVLIMAPVFTFD